MPFIATGTPVEENLIFNSGYIDFGSDRLVDVENITLDVTFVEKEIRRLNSIKMASHKRATLKCVLRAKTKSTNREVLLDVMGTSTVDGAGHLISVTDGQVATLNPVFTTYINDDTARPIQFQLTDAILTTSPFVVALEEFGTIDLELTARDIKVYYSGTVVRNLGMRAKIQH